MIEILEIEATDASKELRICLRKVTFLGIKEKSSGKIRNTLC